MTHPDAIQPNATGQDRHRFGDGELCVVVDAHGAEPHSIRHDNHRELLWQAGPAWPRHAPILFPIVGRLPNDTLRHAGGESRMTQHGFARDRAFSWTERTDTGCRLELRDDPATRAMFPFPFALSVSYAVRNGALDVEYRLRNPGREVLPASLGAHPAFNWPIEPGIAKEEYRLLFEHHEPAPVRRLDGGLLLPDPEPSPICDGVLPLRDTLFAADALILEQVRSGRVRFEGPSGTPALVVSWRGAPQLGLWSKPGAGFLCIEPWAGISTPLGFDGPFETRPHLLHLPPDGDAVLGWTLRVERS
ncbi:MAG: aldose 1-epimerase family protein [Gluconacetobacter diazotrophicus]|nr:aldose 1-epimerase family protein [Gluconacetobacter diazotrophicus]